MSLSVEDRERLLRALEEDRELRYALMGLLGYREVLDRITRLEEEFKKLYERQLRLEERFAKLEERQQRLEEEFKKLYEMQLKLEERQQRLEERQQRLEEEFKKLYERQLRLEERFARLEERQQKLEERMLKLEERMARLEEEMRETRRVVIVIAHRFGVLSEAGLREAMKYVVEEVLGTARVEKKTLWDGEGIVYGHPANVDVDVVVRDGEHILVEVKSRASRSDVAELYRVGRLYEKLEGVKPRLLLIAGFIDPDAWETAVRLGVELRPALRDHYTP